MSELLGFAERVEAIEQESARLVGALTECLDAPVPSCPGWTGRQLAAHVAEAFTYFSHQLAAGDPEEASEPPSYEVADAEDPLEWLDAATAVLLEALGELGPDEPCWNWSGSDLDSGWVARRMALEVALHRHDAELAAGGGEPLPSALAVDGIDERIGLFLLMSAEEHPQATLGGPLCISCSDADASWLVEVACGRLKIRHFAGPAAAVMRASASDIFLASWHRLDLGALELTGDTAVVEAFALLTS